MQTWQMQRAKAQISELVKSAQTQPQHITIHGKPVAVVVSRETFDRLSQTQDTLVDFMRRSPWHDTDEIEFHRDRSATRKVAL